MTKTRAVSLVALAAILGSAPAARGDVDRTAMASRYAHFKQQQTQKWAASSAVGWLTGTLGLGGAAANLQRTLDRALRYDIRLATGTINPSTTPLFGSDFLGSQARLDSRIGVSQAHATATGHDVVVAVLDSGFNLHHPWIASRVLPYGFDPVGHDWDPQDRGNGIDDDGDGTVDFGVGHGTFVAGMVLTAAPGAWILPVRIADDEGRGLDSELQAGLDFAMSMGANVINISYEAGTLSPAVCEKLHEANEQGITVVVSAGNDGNEQMKALAEDGTTISVGATDFDDHVAPFSNTPSDGRGLTIFAPGVDLYGPHGGPSDTTNCTWSGTSFSAPLASGAAALVLEMTPGATPLAIRNRLRAASTAPVIAWNGGVYPFTGRLDLRQVVQP
jgi:subtilisin family serine protease